MARRVFLKQVLGLRGVRPSQVCAGAGFPLEAVSGRLDSIFKDLQVEVGTRTDAREEAPARSADAWLAKRKMGPSVLGFGFEDGVQHGPGAGEPGARVGGGVYLRQLADRDLGVD